MWQSVMSWPMTPWNQITLVTPSMALSSDSIWSRVLPGLRLGLTIELSVAISVPWPSTSIAPPSVTIDAWKRRIPYLASRFRATRLSSAWVCLLPQPLKLKSTPAGPCGPVTKVGPVSRAHRSSTGSGITSTVSPSCCCASSLWSGRAISTTGSYWAMACATWTMSCRTAGSWSPQTSVRAGQAMKVRSCGSHSAGIAYPVPAVGLAEVEAGADWSVGWSDESDEEPQPASSTAAARPVPERSTVRRDGWSWLTAASGIRR